MTFSIKTLLVAILLLTATKTQAQHEISIEAGGGLSTLSYDVLFGDQKNGWGGEFGASYAFFFSPSVGIRSGVNLSYYHAKATISNLSDSYDAFDGEEYFQFRYTMNHYKAKQYALYLNIPLMVQYQHGKQHKLYVAAGGKLGLPLFEKYKTISNNFKTSGYYPSLNVELEEPAFMGFGTFSNILQKNDFDLHIITMLSFEAGMKWRLSERFSLYTGAYFDYSLTNIIKNNFDKPFIKYDLNNPDHFAINGIPTSNYTDSSNKVHSLTEKINPLAVGIKVRVSMTKGNREQVSE